MAKVSKSTGGGWLDKETLKNGDVLKIVTEASVVENERGSQLIARAKVKGGKVEPQNIAINTPSKNALIDAFGDDTTAWIDKILTVAVTETVIGGKSGIALYLVPEGFVKTKDAGGYIVVTRFKDAHIERPSVVQSDVEYEPNPDDVPF